MVERALGILGARGAVDSLIQRLQEYPDSRARHEATEALGAIAAKLAAAKSLPPLAKAIEPLIRTLQDDDAGVRSTAAGALGVFGDMRAVESLTRGLTDPHPWVRSSAAAALPAIAGAAALDPLCALLRDREPGVREAAIQALADIGSLRAIGALQ